MKVGTAYTILSQAVPRGRDPGKLKPGSQEIAGLEEQRRPACVGSVCNDCARLWFDHTEGPEEQRRILARCVCVRACRIPHKRITEESNLAAWRRL